MNFPDGFWWGTGASSPQTEGAAPASDWLAWEEAGMVPPSGDGNGFGTRYREDFELYARYGLKHHRLGIEWARIEPEEGCRDADAVSHYRDMLVAARESGIEPWVCLHHFVLPRWLGAGFRDERVRDYYWKRHVEFVAETYDDLVAGWKPINEPIAYALMGYAARKDQPGEADRESAMYAALEGAHLANFEAARILRRGGKPVASIHAIVPLFPADGSPETAETLDAADQAIWRCWIGAMRDGVFALPGRKAIDLPDYPDAFDLAGFSYYFASSVSPGKWLAPYPADGELGPSGYVPWSEGLGICLDRLAAELPGKPLLISEHGVGGPDELRCRVLAESLQVVSDRLAAGLDIRGFFHWTGVDNYEWSKGFTVPFGLFDRDRRPKPSAELAREVATR